MRPKWNRRVKNWIILGGDHLQISVFVGCNIFNLHAVHQQKLHGYDAFVNFH